MRGLAFYCFLSAALYAVIGMAGGIYMAASHDHTFATAHAHLNLVGWVSMALFGLYYQAVPAAAATRLARLHVAAATLGLWLLVVGIVLVMLDINEAIAVVGALLTIAAMLLFVFIVSRHHLSGQAGERQARA